jgi:hypothetical protein
VFEKKLTLRHHKAQNVITRLVRVIQENGKAKEVAFWIPRINRGMTMRFSASIYFKKKISSCIHPVI